MAFDRRQLAGIGAGVFRYRTRDDAAAVNAAGYWTAAWPLLQRGDAVFRTTLDVNGQAVGFGRHVITAASRTAVSSADGFGGGGVITPPEGAQPTSVTWHGAGVLAIAAGAAGNNDLTYNSGLVDWRGDDDTLTTTAGGAVSSATSGQGITGTAFSNGTGANQGTHSTTGNYLLLSATSATDVDGDFYAVGPARDHYKAGGALGVAYLLIESVGSRPGWDTTLLRVGRCSSTYSRQWGQAYGLQWLGPTSGTLRIYREGATSGTYLQADLGGFLADEAIAIAWVINDSRASGSVSGASDNISRIFAKTKAGGSRAIMGSAQTAATTTPVQDATTLCDLGRSRWNNYVSYGGAANALRVYALGFDSNPPITDAGIEANLDKLLARV